MDKKEQIIKIIQEKGGRFRNYESWLVDAVGRINALYAFPVAPEPKTKLTISVSVIQEPKNPYPTKSFKVGHSSFVGECGEYVGWEACATAYRPQLEAARAENARLKEENVKAAMTERHRIVEVLNNKEWFGRKLSANERITCLNWLREDKPLESQLAAQKPVSEGNLVIVCSGGCGKTTNDVSPAEFWAGKVAQSPDPEELVPVWTCKECAKALASQSKGETK